MLLREGGRNKRSGVNSFIGRVRLACVSIPAETDHLFRDLKHGVDIRPVFSPSAEKLSWRELKRRWARPFHESWQQWNRVTMPGRWKKRERLRNRPKMLAQRRTDTPCPLAKVQS